MSFPQAHGFMPPGSAGRQIDIFASCYDYDIRLFGSSPASGNRIFSLLIVYRSSSDHACRPPSHRIN